MDELRDYIYVVSGALSVGTLLYAWLTGRSKANTGSIAAIDQRLAKAEGALEAVAGQWDTLATSQRDIRDEIGRVHARVDEVARTSSEVAGQLRQIARGMDLLTKHNLAEHGS